MQSATLSNLNTIISVHPIQFDNFIQGGNSWERNGLFTAVYDYLLDNNLVPYEVATSGDPYALVEHYLGFMANLAASSLAL